MLQNISYGMFWTWYEVLCQVQSQGDWKTTNNFFPSSYKYFQKQRNALFTLFGHESNLINTATYLSLALSCARKEENSKEAHSGNYVPAWHDPLWSLASHLSEGATNMAPFYHKGPKSCIAPRGVKVKIFVKYVGAIIKASGDKTWIKVVEIDTDKN